MCNFFFLPEASKTFPSSLIFRNILGSCLMCFLIMMTWNLLILLFYYQYDRNIFYYYIHCLIFATYIVYYFSSWNFCYILDLGSGSYFFPPYFFHFFIFWLSPLRHSLNLIFQTYKLIYNQYFALFKSFCEYKLGNQVYISWKSFVWVQKAVIWILSSAVCVLLFISMCLL